MQTKFLLFVTGAVILFTACNTTPQKPLIKTSYHLHSIRNVGPEAAAHPGPGFSVTEDVNNSNNPDASTQAVDTFVYDESGKVISIHSSNGAKTVITQNGQASISTTTDASGHVTTTRTEFENKPALYDSMVTEQNGAVNTIGVYILDDKGHKVEDRHYWPKGAGKGLQAGPGVTFKYEGDDIVSEISKIPQQVDTITMINPNTLNEEIVIQRTTKSEITTYFDYYADKPNTTKRNSASAHLIKTAVMISDHRDTNEVNDYRYAFDDQGRVIFEVYKSRPGYMDQGNSFLEYDSTAYTYY